MEFDILDEFLDCEMLEIGDNDTRFETLVKVSIELAEILAKDKGKIVSCTLVALDPHIPLNEPILEDVEKMLKKHWRTVRNRFKDRPRALLRAIILNALDIVGKEDLGFAAIIWLTGSSFLPYAKLADCERDICEKVIFNVGNLVEARVAQEWGNSPEINQVKLDLRKIEFPKLNISSVDKATLEEYLAAACGPQRQGNKPFSPDIIPNPSWSNNVTAWAYHFAPTAAKGIAEMVDNVNDSLAEDLSNGVNQLNTEIEKYLNNLNSAITETVQSTITNSMAGTRKTNLLWWKETLYSPILRQSYRSLQPSIAILTMAFDLHQQVPSPYPLSVEFLLRETIQDLFEVNKDVQISPVSLSNFFNDILENRDILQKFIPAIEQSQGRIPLMTLIQEIIYNESKLDEKIGKERIGVAGEQEITLADLAVWCFRDLQVQPLIISQEA